MSRPPFSGRTQVYARNRALANMIDNVKIVRISAPTLNTTTLQTTVSTVLTVYTGRARISLVSGSGVLTVGDETLDTRSTRITIPFSANAQQDDVVLVLISQSDTDTVSRAFKVTDVDAGGLLRSVRTLTCVGYHESRFWTE